jgi:hypothetical protein
MTTHVPPLGARAPKPRLAAVLAALCLVAGALLGATSGCSSTARFPVCQTDDDCKDKETRSSATTSGACSAAMTPTAARAGFASARSPSASRSTGRAQAPQRRARARAPSQRPSPATDGRDRQGAGAELVWVAGLGPAFVGGATGSSGGTKPRADDAAAAGALAGPGPGPGSILPWQAPHSTNSASHATFTHAAWPIGRPRGNRRRPRSSEHRLARRNFAGTGPCLRGNSVSTGLGCARDRGGSEGCGGESQSGGALARRAPTRRQRPCARRRWPPGSTPRQPVASSRVLAANAS